MQENGGYHSLTGQGWFSIKVWDIILGSTPSIGMRWSGCYIYRCVWRLSSLKDRANRTCYCYLMGERMCLANILTLFICLFLVHACLMTSVCSDFLAETLVAPPSSPTSGCAVIGSRSSSPSTPLLFELERIPQECQAPLSSLRKLPPPRAQEDKGHTRPSVYR